ncbi:MAG: aminoglycoside phosphotransferase (APT) family kinase protein, partial [Candidatus Poriferisodalaceae bacterium]
MSNIEFFEPLRSVLTSKIPDCKDLLNLERLSGGASMETYRITIDSDVGERYLCLRRGSGGVNRETPSAVGLDTEAVLMKVARAQGVS